MCASWYYVYQRVFLKKAKEIFVNRYKKLNQFLKTREYYNMTFCIFSQIFP